VLEGRKYAPEYIRSTLSKVRNDYSLGGSKVCLILFYTCTVQEKSRYCNSWVGVDTHVGRKLVQCSDLMERQHNTNCALGTLSDWHQFIISALQDQVMEVRERDNNVATSCINHVARCGISDRSDVEAQSMIAPIKTPLVCKPELSNLRWEVGRDHAAS